jgi:hypothetical protein
VVNVRLRIAILLNCSPPVSMLAHPGWHVPYAIQRTPVYQGPPLLHLFRGEEREYCQLLLPPRLHVHARTPDCIMNRRNSSRRRLCQRYAKLPCRMVIGDVVTERGDVGHSIDSSTPPTATYDAKLEYKHNRRKDKKRGTASRNMQRIGRE